MSTSKVTSAEEAIALIADGSTVAIQGSGGGVCEPTFLMKTLGERFLASGKPRDLTLLHATGLGDQKEIGCDYLAHKGLVRKDIAGHLPRDLVGKCLFQGNREGDNRIPTQAGVLCLLVSHRRQDRRLGRRGQAARNHRAAPAAGWRRHRSRQSSQSQVSSLTSCSREFPGFSR